MFVGGIMSPEAEEKEVVVYLLCRRSALSGRPVISRPCDALLL